MTNSNLKIAHMIIEVTVAPRISFLLPINAVVAYKDNYILLKKLRCQKDLDFSI